MALPPGARLGELEIVRVLAVGGFGIVYVARDHSLDRDVAVKEFMPGQLVARTRGQRVTVRSAAQAETYAAGLRSFVDEAKLLARFSHPAMVKVYRILEANGTAYMVMPYLPGPTLTDVRRSMSEPPTESWLLRVVNPLLDALALLHGQGIYHRDISPDNVLMSGGAPVLLDFGAARQLIGDRTQSLTAVLKPRYAPIEQYAEATQLRQGPWTDLYALGALLTFLLDGEPPPVSTARAIHDERVPLATRRIPGVSPALLSAIDRALAVRPQDRPQSAAEFRRALNGWPAAPAVAPMRLPKVSAVAETRPAEDPAEPFEATVELTRTEPVAGAGRAFAWRLARRVGRSWRVGLGGAFLALAVAWPVARQVAASSANAGAGTPASSAAVGVAGTAEPLAAPVPGASTAPPGATAPDGSATANVWAPVDAVSARSDASVEAPPDESAGPGKTATESSVAAPGTPSAPPARRGAGHADRSRHSAPPAAAGRGGRTAALPARSPGPVELCAGHNFFLRPYCLQRECDAPRFKQDAYCVRLRQAAQSRRDQFP